MSVLRSAWVLRLGIGIGACLACIAAGASTVTLEWTERKPTPPKPTAPVRPRPATALQSAEPSSGSPLHDLSPVRFCNLNTRDCLPVRLYDETGNVDESVAQGLDRLMSDTRDPEHPSSSRIDRRLLQLIVKAAYFFESGTVELVSGYRRSARRTEGPHAKGLAADFKLKGTAARKIASYLRSLPRVGVGVYTHPRTQYVHLDVREKSFHWLDASPPNHHWREQSLGGRGLAERDAAYTPLDDLPFPTTSSAQRAAPPDTTQ